MSNLDSCIDNLNILIKALEKYKSGVSLSAVCREYNLDYMKFRRYIDRNFDLLKADSNTVYPKEIIRDKECMCDTDNLLTWQERLYLQITGVCFNKSMNLNRFREVLIQIPLGIDENVDYLLKNALSDNEKFVIEGRFHYKKTLLEIAKDLGLTTERIRQIESATLRKLRHPSYRRVLNLGYKFCKGVDKERENILIEKRKKIEGTAFQINVEEDLSNVEKIVALAATSEADNYIISVLPEGYINIDSLGLSMRVYNALKRGLSLQNIKELDGLSLGKLFKVRNLGVRCLEEFMKKVLPYITIIKVKN